MRTSFPLILAALLTAPLAAQQPLVCPGATAGRPCDVWHYHVQLYRPDNKQRVEISATPQFATQAACERARDARVAANAKVIEFLRGVKQMQYEPDRFGPCHCDLTAMDAQRTMQIRTAEEIRLRVREKLLDLGLPTDSEVVRALDLDPPTTPQLGAPKFVPPPQNLTAAVVTSPDDLKSTRTIDTSKPSIAALDLPLVDIGAPASPPAVPPASPPAPSVAPAPETPVPAPEPAAPAPAPVPEAPLTETRVEAEPTEEEMQSAQETAERFVSYETQRIQNILAAANGIADESVKSKIFEACMQRIQLLSNLRLLIEGSGMRGRLAIAAREAETESERLILIARLFGDDVRRHWAPKNATDVVLDVAPEVAAEPDRVLRDSSGKYTAQQKKHALYLVLAQTQPAEDQRLWLSTVVEEFLR